jgi:predicted Ser/Thr protein kinase
MTTEPAGDILIERFEIIACSKCNQPIDTTGVPPFSVRHCPSCGTEFRVPARFANFVLLEQLGKGGMGAVYKAYDETLGRTVAIKVMQQSIGQDRAFVEQFLQEARALAAINNPHIVQIYTYGEENGQPYIVMELVDGGRLDHIHEKQHALDEVFVLQTALQIIKGLQAANAAGMTHGDIKPGNILFDRAGNAKVADFGLARFKGEKPKPGEVWGTPYYVAPEVVKGQAPNAASDIFSLGATLYHVLTGEPPFNGETVTDTVLLRFKEPAPHPHEFRKSVTPKTSAILLRMLEMDPFARYPTYESVLKDITDALSALQDARGGKKPPPKKNIAGPVMAGLVALALIVGLTYVGMHIFKVKQEEKRAQAQRQADIAEGRLVPRMIDGQIRYVRREPGPAAGAGEAGGSAAAPTDQWSIPARVDTAVTGDGKSPDLMDRTVMLLRGGNDENLEKSGKIYLRFPLAGVDKTRLKRSVLKLTVYSKGSRKAKTPDYQMQGWALKTDPGWDEMITWANAPGNDPTTTGGLRRESAELLTTFDLPANPVTGELLQIAAKSLTDFIRNYSGNDLTLVLTGDMNTDHKNGWLISATEKAGQTPPTLLLNAKE